MTFTRLFRFKGHWGVGFLMDISVRAQFNSLDEFLWNAVCAIHKTDTLNWQS